jgi:peptidoglycan/xylan/chitin deacetylase (PgdA/CDA1 family)
MQHVHLLLPRSGMRQRILEHVDGRQFPALMCIRRAAQQQLPRKLLSRAGVHRTNYVPRWDAIAYLIRELTLDEDREPAILAVLRHYKRTDNTDGDAFMSELKEETECIVPDPGRRFLNWSEAKEMRRGGMTIGSHTYTHHILGQLPLDSQRWELEQSKQTMEEQLGTEISTLAYPVGSTTAFSQSTEEIAHALGYRMCFSFYGGLNTPGTIRQTDIFRTSMPTEFSLFRTETTLLTRFGRLPY